MKNPTVFSWVAATFSFFFLSVTATEKSYSQPQKIIIFTSKGGYGHMAACATLKNTLKDYDVSIVNPFEEIVSSTDWVKRLTFGYLDGETFYNNLLQNGWTRTMNVMFNRPARYLVHRNRHKIERKIYNFLENKKPDLLISTIPFLNYSASSAAHRYQIPFILITLDADLTTWLPGMEKCPHKNFAVTVGIKTPRISQQLTEKNIPAERIYEVGMPLRPDFFESKDDAKIRAEWNFPTNKPIALLSRGGSGSQKLIEYARALLKVDYPLHLVVCVGRNESLIPKLKRFKLGDNVSLSIIPFTTRMSDLIFAANIIITQPSPNVCNEAMHFGVPILVDNSAPLFWEKATIDLIDMHGTGATFKRTRHLPQLVKQYMRLDKQPKIITKAGQFDQNIQRIVAQLLQKPKGGDKER